MANLVIRLRTTEFEHEAVRLPQLPSVEPGPLCVVLLTGTADTDDPLILTQLAACRQGDDDLTVRIVHLPLWPEECSSDSILEGVLGVTEIQGQRHTPLVVIDR